MVRHLTPREAATLMGAGDYELPIRDSLALSGFGDAVCVPVIEWIARNHLKPLVDDVIRHGRLGRPRRSAGIE